MIYGAAEFSRDTDLVVLAEPDNLQRLQQTLTELQAIRIAVPPFEQRYLDRGLAVHFRCGHPEALHLRIDVMSKLRGVDEFPALWERRTTALRGGTPIDLLALPDLVQAKKTQRDKDWPMLQRLVEANYFANRDRPAVQQVTFWLTELRSAELLVDVAQQFAPQCEQLTRCRPLLALATGRDLVALAAALRAEEEHEREADRAYWRPLKQELERLRHEARMEGDEVP